MKTKKRIIIISVILILIGLIIFGGTFAMSGFKISNLNGLTYVTNEYNNLESFENISINGYSNIHFIPSEDRKVKVVCEESEEVYNTVEVKNNTLTINQIDTRKWYENIALFYRKDMNINVYLPINNVTGYKNLEINSTSGNISIVNNFVFENADIKATSGSITFDASTKADTNVKTTSGCIHLASNDAANINVSSTSGEIVISDFKAFERLNAQSTSGRIYVSNGQSDYCFINNTSGGSSMENYNIKNDISIKSTSGGVKLNRCEAGNIEAKTTSGSIKLNECDGNNLNLKSTSGSIKGNLLSDKIFAASSKNGKITVPKSTIGGLCEVSTTSGSINISIVK